MVYEMISGSDREERVLGDKLLFYMVLKFIRLSFKKY